MLDLKFVREHPEKVREAIALKNEPADLDRLLELDGKRRRLLQEAEELKRLRNRVSKEIGLSKGDRAAVERKKEEMRQVSGKIKELDEELRRFDGEMEQILLRLPNIPDPAVPSGEDEADNMEVRSWGEPPQFPFSPRPHWEIGEMLGIIDFPRAGKITGSRFALYCGDGARLERALINFMLDLHTGEHGYREIFPPFLVNSGSMTGTGQLPKFAEDAFKVEGADYYLIPTAEVPVTNLHRDEILDAADLPLRYVAYSACFRSEAGAHGRDTRGLIRNHQFNKVELVKFVHPDNSFQELEVLRSDAEAILQGLELPYRVMLLCTGDMGFASAKTYDLEAHSPGADQWLEVSSCSCFTDFQARRARVKFRPEPHLKSEFVHTLNGSGLALPRTMVAVLENYQNKDGTVTVPEVLRPYMKGQEVIDRS